MFHLLLFWFSYFILSRFLIFHFSSCCLIMGSACWSVFLWGIVTFSEKGLWCILGIWALLYNFVKNVDKIILDYYLNRSPGFATSPAFSENSLNETILIVFIKMVKSYKVLNFLILVYKDPLQSERLQERIRNYIWSNPQSSSISNKRTFKQQTQQIKGARGGLPSNP